MRYAVTLPPPPYFVRTVTDHPTPRPIGNNPVKVFNRIDSGVIDGQERAVALLSSLLQPRAMAIGTFIRELAPFEVGRHSLWYLAAAATIRRDQQPALFQPRARSP